MPIDSINKKRLSVGLLILIVIVAAFIRVPGYGASGLWNDEAIVAAVAEHPLPELIEKVRMDAHPPLFFVIQRFVRKAVGYELWTEWGVRLISIVLGLLTIPAMYFVGRELISNRAGLLAAFLLAISPMHVHYSREGRNYALLMTLVLLALYAASVFYKQPTVKKGIAAAVIFSALVYTHNISLFFLASIGTMLLISILIRRAHGDLQALGALLLGGVLLLLPWIPVIVNQAMRVSQTSARGSGPVEWVKPYWEALFPMQVPTSLSALTHGSMPPVDNFVYEVWPTAWIALGISLLLILLGLLSRRAWRIPWSAPLLIVAAIGPLVLMFIASWLGTPFYTPGRVDTIALPAFVLLMSSSAVFLRVPATGQSNVSELGATVHSSHGKKIVRKLIMSCLWVVPLIVLCILSYKPIVMELNAERGDKNRAWIRYFSRYMSDGDVFFVTAKWWTSLEYYLPRFGRDLYLVGFPSARELHPNWLDWSEYPAPVLTLDALAVAEKAQAITEAEGSTAWIYPGRLFSRKRSEIGTLMTALRANMEEIEVEGHPRVNGQTYYAFRPTAGAGDASDSLHRLTGIADKYPAKSSLQFRAARKLQVAGRYEDSALYFRRISVEQPEYADSMFWLGFAYQQSGKYLESAEAYRDFLTLQPEHFQARFNFAMMLMRQGKCEQAVPNFQDAIELTPGYAQAHLHLSKCHSAMGNEDEARRHLQIYKDGKQR